MSGGELPASHRAGGRDATQLTNAMDTNNVPVAIQLFREIVHLSPLQVATQIAVWGTALTTLGMVLGRAWHAFQTGAGMVAGVISGTNQPKAVIQLAEGLANNGSVPPASAAPAPEQTKAEG